MTRRQWGAVAAVGAAAAPAQTTPRREQIAMLLYPGMTALDLVGPQQVFGYTMGADVHLVWKTREVVTTDTGIPMMPTKTFAECPDPVNLLFVPGGGRGTVALMSDEVVLGFLAGKGRSAKLVTSVCSGSLVLGAAGLLRGYKATSHWAVRDVLPLLGATAVDARYVEDRNRITAGGITSGIDFGLRVAARMRGESYGRALELMLEYDPEPPFGTGTPAKAGEKLTKELRAMYAPLHEAATAAARRLQPRE